MELWLQISGLGKSEAVMVTLFLICFLGFPILWKTVLKDLVKVGGFFVAALITIMASMVCAVVVLAISGFTQKINLEEYKSFSFPIVSLSHKSNVEGDYFFLGSGTVREVEYYFMYRKRDEHLYSKSQLSVYRSMIQETDEPPEVEVYEYRVKKAWKPFVFDLGKQKRQRYIIKVPHNTIIKEFDKVH
jgi:hypothetical protein